MKKLLIFALLFILGVTIPVGCTANRTQNPASPGVSDNVLSVYNFATYIDPDVITEFEQRFKAKVQYDTYENNEALLAKIQPGNPGYDIIVPTGDFVENMSKQGLLEELDRSNIPNFKNIDEKFIDPPFDPGNKYSVPYQWGTMGLGYNIKKTGTELTSWTDFLQPKYKGRVAVLEDSRAVLGVMLIYLGYDANSTNPEEIKKAKDLLVQGKDVIATFAPDTGQDLLNQGEVDIALEWNGDIFQVMEENEDIRYTIPKEGTIVWTDNLAIAKGAPHKKLAEQFINFILEPEIGAKISNYVKFGSPNKAAIEQKLINKEDLENPNIYPPDEVFNKLKYVKDLGKETGLYDEAWTDLKVAVGK